MGWMHVLVCKGVGVRWRGWCVVWMGRMGDQGVVHDALVLAHSACPFVDEATRERTPETCGTAECEDALRAFTDTMLEEMKEGFLVSGRVREGMEWGREGEREGM